jgi:hypothetical protein
MNLQFQRPGRSDIRLLLLYWLLAAPIICFSYYQEYGLPKALYGVSYTIVLDTAAVYLLVFCFLPMALARWNPAIIFGALIGFVIIDAHVYRLGYWLIFSSKPFRWDAENILYGVMRHTQSYGMLGILMAGKRYFDIQQRLLLTQKAQTESELRNLKAQIDPHFLFNNLNVLRGLIQHDPAEANEYLNRFAALYRFLIRHKDEDVVTLAEELQFVNEYIYLLRHRFGTAYSFRQELPAPPTDLHRLLVLPGTLQLLVENAIKHNAGDEDDPLVIRIEATDTALTVRHNRRPKLTPVDSTGTGLNNLRERYRLLFGQEIEVTDTADTFAVTVPVLRQAQAWSAA